MPEALLVTDSDWVVNDVSAALSIGDWSTEVVSDPHTVAGVAAEQHPDVILVDMQVGSMGGMAIIRDVRAKFQDTKAPRMVLLLDRSADRFLSKRAMADAAVLKPFSAEELRNAVVEVSGEYRADELVGSEEE